MIDLSNTITPKQLAEEVGMSVATASKMLKDNLDGVKVGNTTLYPRDKAVHLVALANAKVLEFVGYVPSFPTNVAVDETPEVAYFETSSGTVEFDV